MIVDFIKSSPAQNTTVLVTGYCPPDAYHAVARRAMSYECLHAEQVGFIVSPSGKDSVLRLEMAGGEFCGNAALSAAALAIHKGLTDRSDFCIEVSGAAGPVSCRVERRGRYRYHASCTMPPARRAEELELTLGDEAIKGRIIEFDGISHFVFPVEGDFTGYSDTMDALKRLTDTDAVGVIPYETLEDGSHRIKPLVHVRSLNSSVFERGCGSGSLALGIHLEAEGCAARGIDVLQPGGVIRVEIGETFSISTDVEFTCEGSMLV